VGELYSLARFVRFYPYAHYFCIKKGCNCASLHYRFDPKTSACCKCGHAKAQHRSHFASEISTPIKRFGFLGAGRTAMEKLRTDVLDKILLRRTKEERQADIQLPPLKISIRKDTLSAEERDFYTSMYMQSRTKFDTYVERDTLLHNYAHVFDLIMRLRQAVDHPYLIVHGSLRQENGPIPSKSRGDAHVCALCQDDVTERSELVVASCGHAFHRDCVNEYLEQAPTLPTGGIGCPTCFAPLTLSLEEGDDDDAAGAQVPESPEAALAQRPQPRSILQRIKTAEFKTSTKIEALLQEVQQMTQKSGSSKALVFSQFVNFLELIEWRLKREGVAAAKLLGTMPITSRNNIILSFMSDPNLKVLLISLKAGGEGLNLQAADHIFLMDPWWNPASELQAIQRAHRIGQTRPVKAVRFVMADTIEEKIIELQNKKQSVFDCTVGGSNTALQRLTSEDIKFLFNQ
jgi:DNA repair protein RAD16